MSRTFFITGTDTGVGKTTITGALLLSADWSGLRAAGVKPVATGCESRQGVLENPDVFYLTSSANVDLGYAQVNPVALKPAIAPHIAAQRAGRVIRVDALAEHVRALEDRCDLLLIEGAGGWLVPLNETETLADLAVALRCPVVLVVGMKLGCLNHALLTAAAIRAAGLPLAGWVANSTEPRMEALKENVRALEERLPGPRLGTVPYLADPAPEFAAAWIDGPRLWDP